MRVEVDPNASEVSFVLDAVMHKVKGTFSVRSGTILVDPQTGTISGDIEVDATSGDTANGKRDRKMHGKVLESVAHPEIRLALETYEGDLDLTGESRITIAGRLSLLGTEHPITLPIDVTIDSDRVEATAEFNVPYVDWGLKDPSNLVLRVGKSVDVTVLLVGTLDSAGDAGSHGSSSSGPVPDAFCVATSCGCAAGCPSA